jgi:probable F420-dependent oxidoreductase
MGYAAVQRWGRVGAGIAVPPTPAEVWRRELVRLEQSAYGSVWINEGIGGWEAMSQLGLVLASTERLVAASGVANIWARHGATAQAGAANLADAYPGRLVLGLGVSNPAVVEPFGVTYRRPLAAMREYLDRMDGAAERAVRPAVPFPRLLAALGPKMLELAAERADGAYPHTMPVEHTALARRALGPDRLLVVGLGAVLDHDRARARAAARRAGVFRLPNSPYLANFRRLGYPEDELTGRVSDRVIDAALACGDADVVAARIREHLDAGADHVVVQMLGADLPGMVTSFHRLAEHLPS